MTYPHGGAAQIWRDGVGGAHEPEKDEIRDWAKFLEDRVFDLPIFQAAGDGTTNDKAVIDTLNTSDNVVNLAGKTYAYTGDFVPVARFYNGIIVSSTLGTFDYTTDSFPDAKTVTVGAGQTFTTLKAAFNWLRHMRFEDMTLTVTGDHDLADITFKHRDSGKLTIQGSAAVTMPTAADMVGTRATDEALIVGRFAATIDVGGTGDSTTGGVNFPYGIRLNRICITGNTRYMVGVGYNESHANSTNGSILRISDVAVVGGVWGFLAVAAQVRIPTGTRFFGAYQNTGTQPGGPFDLINSHARFEGHYEAYSAGQASKYGLFAEAGSRVLADQRVIVTGPFLHGIYVKDQSSIDCDILKSDGVSQPITALSGSTVDCISYDFANGDVANTNTLTGAGQNGWGNNNSASALVHSGFGSVVSLSGGTMTNMVASYGFHAIGGKIYQGTTAVAVDDCRFSVAFSRWYTASGYIAFNITNPKAGSLDQNLALAISTVRVGTNSGASFGPALDTTTNGNLFASTG